MGTRLGSMFTTVASDLQPAGGLALLRIVPNANSRTGRQRAAHALPCRHAHIKLTGRPLALGYGNEHPITRRHGVDMEGQPAAESGSVPTQGSAHSVVAWHEEAPAHKSLPRRMSTSASAGILHSRKTPSATRETTTKSRQYVRRRGRRTPVKGHAFGRASRTAAQPCSRPCSTASWKAGSTSPA